jgi:hypothetical protein
LLELGDEVGRALENGHLGALVVVLKLGDADAQPVKRGLRTRG